MPSQFLLQFTIKLPCRSLSAHDKLKNTCMSFSCPSEYNGPKNFMTSTQFSLLVKYDIIDHELKPFLKVFLKFLFLHAFECVWYKYLHNCGRFSSIFLNIVKQRPWLELNISKQRRKSHTVFLRVYDIACPFLSYLITKFKKNSISLRKSTGDIGLIPYCDVV